MFKTKWKTEADRIILQPDLILNAFGILFLLVFIGLGISAQNELLSNSRTMTFYLIIFGSVPVLFFLLARNQIIFDRIDQKMYVRPFGLFTIRSVPFDNIAAVNAVYQYGTAFNFQVFKKTDRHGKGIRISSGYGKETNKNAVAFTNEVFPLIEDFLKDVFATEPVPEPITTFEYYSVDQGIYTLKFHAAVNAFIGAALVVWSIYSFFSTNSLSLNNPLLITFIPFIFGLLILTGANNKITFDTNTGTIYKTTMGGLRKKEYPFSAYLGFSIIRKTTNFVHSGTDAGIKIDTQDGNYKVLVLKAFNRTKKIERFILETETILHK